MGECQGCWLVEPLIDDPNSEDFGYCSKCAEERKHIRSLSVWDKLIEKEKDDRIREAQDF